MAKYQNSFRATVWDPILIIAQITAVQAISYVTLSLLVTAGQILLGVDSSLDHILSFRAMRSDTVFGWTLSGIWLIQAGIGVLLLGYIVERVRQCIDFTLTFFLIHFMMVTLYSKHIPSYFFWWFNIAVDAVLMIVGGEWFCMRREMRPIQFGQSEDASSGGTDLEAGSPVPPRGTSRDYHQVNTFDLDAMDLAQNNNPGHKDLIPARSSGDHRPRYRSEIPASKKSHLHPNHDISDPELSGAGTVRGQAMELTTWNQSTNLRRSDSMSRVGSRRYQSAMHDPTAIEHHHLPSDSTAAPPFSSRLLPKRPIAESQLIFDLRLSSDDAPGPTETSIKRD